MQQFTGSISRGDTAEAHNTRKCYKGRNKPGNIDFDRTHENVVLVDRPLEAVYRERFADALAAYNANQIEKKHPERQIPDYLEKVRADKKLQPMYEFIVQVGNIDERPRPEVATEIYRKFLDGFEARYGRQFAVKQAIVHHDETTPHMHLEVVPVAESKRGLAVQNSLNKAIQQSGHSDYKDMLAGWDGILTEVMARHGIERVAGDRERQMGGVDINTYKRSLAAQESAMAAEAEAAKARAEAESARAEAAEARKDVARALDAVPVPEVQKNGLLGTVKAADAEAAIAAARLETAKAAAVESLGWRKRAEEAEEEAHELRAEVGRLRRQLERVQFDYSSLQEKFGIVREACKRAVAVAMRALRALGAKDQERGFRAEMESFGVVEPERRSTPTPKPHRDRGIDIER